MRIERECAQRLTPFAGREPVFLVRFFVFLTRISPFLVIPRPEKPRLAVSPRASLASRRFSRPVAAEQTFLTLLGLAPAIDPHPPWCNPCQLALALALELPRVDKPLKMEGE